MSDRTNDLPLVSPSDSNPRRESFYAWVFSNGPSECIASIEYPDGQHRPAIFQHLDEALDVRGAVALLAEASRFPFELRCYEAAAVVKRIDLANIRQ
jgi:hypothetical protein